MSEVKIENKNRIIQEIGTISQLKQKIAVNDPTTLGLQKEQEIQNKKNIKVYNAQQKEFQETLGEDRWKMSQRFKRNIHGQNKHQINKQQRKAPTQFMVYCQENKYIYQKLYPHLDSIQRTDKLREQFEKIKLELQLANKSEIC